MFVYDGNVSVPLFSFLVFFCFTSYVSSVTPDCVLVNKDSAAEKAFLEGLHDLRGETFSLEEKVDGKVRTVYEIGVCAGVNKSLPQVGALQHSVGDKENTTTVLGYFNATTLTGSHGPGAWTLLTYKNGDKYNNTCGNSSREAQLMVVCDSTVHHVLYGALQLPTPGLHVQEDCDGCKGPRADPKLQLLEGFRQPAGRRLQLPVPVPVRRSQRPQGLQGH